MGTLVNHDFLAAIPGPLLKLLREEPVLRRAFVVGGFVRDALLGCASKDIDVEVFDTDFEKLVNALGRWGRVDLVGKSFGVIKLTLPGCATVDFSLPRPTETLPTSILSTKHCHPLSLRREGTSQSTPCSTTLASSWCAMSMEVWGI